MSARRRICAVTGSRADWGLLVPVLRAIRDDPGLESRLIATGSHLESAYGGTLSAIDTDGFTPDAIVPLALSGDTAGDVCGALGRAVAGIGDALARLEPDLLLVLGDRYEILGAVQAAMIHRVPVAHIAGGDLTAGAFDDGIRHAISKLSHLHFVTNDAARRRLLQMGEDPSAVHLTGSPGIDAILQTAPLPRAELENRLGFRFRTRNVAVAYHPETLSDTDPAHQARVLVDALARLDSDIGIIATGANADPGGMQINQALAAFCAGRDHACMQSSLGQAGWYGLLATADALVGNSSAGLYEAPTFGTPTVNIGDRQAGRVRANSVFDCALDADRIVETIEHALTAHPTDIVNPYGDGSATGRILAVLTADWPADWHSRLLHKGFIEQEAD